MLHANVNATFAATQARLARFNGHSAPTNRRRHPSRNPNFCPSHKKYIQPLLQSPIHLTRRQNHQTLTASPPIDHAAPRPKQITGRVIMATHGASRTRVLAERVR
ncbi:hypothetical protein PILCRDRAFT_716547 [Piloderma croceum F 1598]|uniref:Uncharacterized protein n=1 Tax=Piloderma croceum (strain F 1598) TaxID=765440 RepID=A0A0C3EMW9_PILCF|nr:hypothetical protein PILCRDRAFT_716547 [Piloderma croceum F 1598]